MTTRVVRPASSRRCAALLVGTALAATAVFVTAGRGVAAQAPAPTVLPAGIERVTSVEGITEYRLANGLRVLLFPDGSKQTITVNVTYLVGSRHEDYGESGMAHLLEHLVFRGTPRHPNIPQELSEHGARPNGTTWFDRTNYFETFAATDENLTWALDLEADRMVNSFIAKRDLDAEMTVVRNEFESGENRIVSVLFGRIASTAYLWHNYGNATIGARADIENVPIERLQAFYKRYYQPDNAVLLVAGRMDETKTLELIGRFFGQIPRPTRLLQKTYTAEPVQDGERSVTVRRVGNVQYAAAGYHVPSGGDPDYPAVDLLVHVLGDAPAGRLHKALVETKKATNVLTRAVQLHDPSLAIFGAEVRQESSLDEARDVLVRTVEEIVRNPPTSEEVERVRASLLKRIELDLNASNRVGLQLSEWIGMGDWRLLFLYRDRLRKASAEDVRRVAGRYLKESNRTVGLFVPTATPDRADIPSPPNLAEVLKDYKGDTLVAVGEAFDPSPSNIEARTARSVVASGLKMTLVSKKTRGATVVANLTLRFGDENSLANRTTPGQLAAAMLMHGTATRTRQQLQDELDRLKARVTINGGATSATASIETVRDNLPAVVRLVSEMMREPAFPQAEFEQIRQQRVAGFEQQATDPQAIATNAFDRHMRPHAKGDVRYVRTVAEAIADLKAATLDDVKRFHADFYGASNGELAVIGDFDANELTSVVSDRFGGWKSPKPFARVADPFQDVKAVSQSFETPDKANATFLAGLNLDVRDDDPDYPALVLGNYLLGGGFLNSRLATRIRTKEGISYGISSQLQVSAFDKGGLFIVRAIYAPQNAARLEAAFREEMDRALRAGFSPEEVKAARAGWLQNRQVGRAQDTELAGRLANLSYAGRTLAWEAELEKRIDAVTPAAIQAALQRHMAVAKMTIVKAGDFARLSRNASQ